MEIKVSSFQATSKKDARKGSQDSARGPCSTRFYAGHREARARPARKRGVQGAEVHDMKASLCRERERFRGTGAEDGTREREGERREANERKEKKRKKKKRQKKKARPDNRPIPPLAENTENRESASLLLSSSFSLPSLSHVSRFPGILRDLWSPYTL